MSNRFSSAATPAQSANDNGPLSRGQVKALKIAIAVMSFLIVAALLAIVGRVIYLASVKRSSAPPPVATITSLTPDTSLELPRGAGVKRMSIDGNHLLVHYQGPAGSGALVVDLVSGKTLSRISFTSGTPADEKPAAANQ